MNNVEPSFGNQLSCVVIIIIFSSFGGVGVHFATQGLNPPITSSFKRWKLLPLISGFVFPTIIAQLLWGAIAYNGLIDYFDTNYRDIWGKWIRIVCTALILLRTGLELELEGKGIKFLLFSFIPPTCEAILVAIISHSLMNFHWEFAFSLGFLHSALAAAVILPPIIKLRDQNYSPSVNALLLSSSGFKVGFSLILQSVFNSIGILNIGNPGSNLSSLIIKIITQLFAGLGMPLIIANLLRPFKGKSDLVKAAAIIALLQLHMWFFTYYDMPEGAVLSQIYFGYRAKIILERRIPTIQIRYFWYFCMPFLFGHVGCQFDLRSIKNETVGASFVCVIAGMLIRILAGSMCTDLVVKTTKKERIFIGLAGLPKLAVQCSYGGKLLSTATTTAALASLKGEGFDFLTSALICAIFAGIVSSIILENFGVRMLVLEQTTKGTCPNEIQPVLGGSRQCKIFIKFTI